MSQVTLFGKLLSLLWTSAMTFSRTNTKEVHLGGGVFFEPLAHLKGWRSSEDERLGKPGENRNGLQHKHPRHHQLNAKNKTCPKRLSKPTYFERRINDIHSHWLDRTDVTDASSPFQAMLTRWDCWGAAVHAMAHDVWVAESFATNHRRSM